MSKPSTYKEEYAKMLIEHMARGLSLRAFCGFIKVHHQTVYNWLETYPDFKEARDIGWDMSRLFWEQMGIDLASGMIKGNATIWIINMCNRFKEDWRRTDEEKEEDNSKEVTINLSYSKDKYRQVSEKKTEPVKEVKANNKSKVKPKKKAKNIKQDKQ